MILLWNTVLNTVNTLNTVLMFSILRVCLISSWQGPNQLEAIIEKFDPHNLTWVWRTQLADLMYQQPWYLHCITYFTCNDTRMLLSGQCLFSTVCFLSMDSSSIRAVKLRHYLDISVVAFELSAVSVNVGKNWPDGLKTDLIHLDSFFCKLGADQLEMKLK